MEISNLLRLSQMLDMNIRSIARPVNWLRVVSFDLSLFREIVAMVLVKNNKLSVLADLSRSV